MNNHIRYIISTSLEIDDLLTFFKLYPIIKSYYKSISIIYSSHSLNDLYKLNTIISELPFLKNIHIIYSSQIIYDNDIDKLNEILNYIKNTLHKIINFKFNHKEIFIISKFNNNNHNHSLLINNINKSKTNINIIYDFDWKYEIIKHNNQNTNLKIIYSFNNIVYSDLTKIKKNCR